MAARELERRMQLSVGCNDYNNYICGSSKRISPNSPTTEFEDISGRQNA